MTDRARFAVAFVAGIMLALLGLISGFIVILAVLVAIVLTLVNFGRWAFAGVATSAGLTWAVMFSLAAVNCASPDQPCGATPINLVPYIAASAALAAVGIAAAISARRSRQRRAASS